MKNKLILISTTFFTICFLTIIFFIVGLNLKKIDTFRDSCENFGGEYYEIANASCSVGHENCIYMCILNGEYYSLDEVGSYNINKFFCIKDCEYENKLNEGSCMC